jgi:mevalonate pyrophosphate decarboxylase
MQNKPVCRSARLGSASPLLSTHPPFYLTEFSFLHVACRVSSLKKGVSSSLRVPYSGIETREKDVAEEHITTILKVEE